MSPMEISGLCGRLLCCLRYEHDQYQAVKRRFPKVGRAVETPHGTGKVIKVCVLRETVTVLFEDGSTVDLTAEQLAGEEPPAPISTPGAARHKALEEVLGQSERSSTKPAAAETSREGASGRSRGGRSAGRRVPSSRAEDANQDAEDAEAGGAEADAASRRPSGRSTRRRSGSRMRRGPGDTAEDDSAQGPRQTRQEPSRTSRSGDGEGSSRSPSRRRRRPSARSSSDESSS